MKASLRQTSSFLLVLVLAGALAAAARQAPRPATNDFLLRAPASAIDDLALRHGLEVLRVVSTSPDALGRNLYLVRAPQDVSAQSVVSEVLAAEPGAAGIEPAVLASLPETYKDLNLVQRTRAILGQVVQASRLVPPGGKIDSYWIGPVTDRQIGRLETKTLALVFQNPASLSPAGYALTVAAQGGVAVVLPLPEIRGNEVRFQIVNLGLQTLTVSSITPRWPDANGRLVGVKLAGKPLIDTVIESAFGTHLDGTVRYVWRAFVEQPAAAILRVDEATKSYKGRGSVVAIIDSGVDPDHPLLRNVLLPGYDFTRDLATASEWNDVLDQRTRAILGQRTRAILGGDSILPLNVSTAAVLDAAEIGQLDPSTVPPAFGHGTMVAGVVHRVAPEAKILPLKAFDGNGQGHLFDVVRAIYYAVDQGVTVINMSFSLEEFSPELMRAVNYAVSRGVACVASAGNDGRETLVFPASLGGTIGVAATAADDRLSPFSNYGSDVVTISAPGEDILTVYPGGRWALASGTSFAAPWISGIAAVFAQKNGRGRRPDIADFYLASEALSHAVPVPGVADGDAGFGRADLAQAVGKLKGGLIYDGPDRADYSITLTLANGCALTYPPADGPAGCPVEPRTQLEFPDDHKMIWRLTNTGSVPLTIQSLTIQWPGENGRMKSIQWNGGTIYDDHGLPPRLDLRLGIDKPAPRLDPGQTGILKLEFDSKALTT